MKAQKSFEKTHHHRLQSLDQLDSKNNTNYAADTHCVIGKPKLPSVGQAYSPVASQRLTG
jgi:hypothetical protein